MCYKLTYIRLNVHQQPAQPGLYAAMLVQPMPVWLTNSHVQIHLLSNNASCLPLMVDPLYSQAACARMSVIRTVPCMCHQILPTHTDGGRASHADVHSGAAEVVPASRNISLARTNP
jgi:hypothetical protein